MQITRLHHAQITVPPSAETDARTFIAVCWDCLKCPNRRRCSTEVDFGSPLAIREIHIGVESGIVRSKTKVHLAYQVDDLAAWRSKLTHAGLTILESIRLMGLTALSAAIRSATGWSLYRPGRRTGTMMDSAEFEDLVYEALKQFPTNCGSTSTTSIF